MIDVSLITVNYNGLKDTCEMIESFGRINTSVTFEIIVVDNASKVNEAAVIKEHYPSVKIIRSEANLGFAGGNNLGISLAEGKYLFFINNDTYVLDSPFEPLIHKLESDRNIGLVCPKIRFSESPNYIQFAGYTQLSSITLRNQLLGFGCPDSEQYNRSIESPYAHGAAMLIARSTLNRVGLMREEYFLYYEELDWSVRIVNSGYKIYYVPEATVFHKESRSTGQDSPLKTYYLTRNRLLFAYYNLPFAERVLTQFYLICLAAPIHVVKDLFRHRKTNALSTIRAVKDYFTNKTGNSYVRFN